MLLSPTIETILISSNFYAMKIYYDFRITAENLSFLAPNFHVKLFKARCLHIMRDEHSLRLDHRNSRFKPSCPNRLRGKFCAENDKFSAEGKKNLNSKKFLSTELYLLQSTKKSFQTRSIFLVFFLGKFCEKHHDVSRAFFFFVSCCSLPNFQ